MARRNHYNRGGAAGPGGAGGRGGNAHRGGNENLGGFSARSIGHQGSTKGKGHSVGGHQTGTVHGKHGKVISAKRYTGKASLLGGKSSKRGKKKGDSGVVTKSKRADLEQIRNSLSKKVAQGESLKGGESLGSTGGESMSAAGGESMASPGMSIADKGGFYGSGTLTGTKGKLTGTVTGPHGGGPTKPFTSPTPSRDPATGQFVGGYGSPGGGRPATDDQNPTPLPGHSGAGKPIPPNAPGYGVGAGHYVSQHVGGPMGPEVRMWVPTQKQLATNNLRPGRYHRKKPGPPVGY